MNQHNRGTAAGGRPAGTLVLACMLGLTWPSQVLADPAAPPTPPQVMSHAPGERIPIPRLSGPIQLDGVIDEPAWEAVAPVAFTTHWPEFGKTPGEVTEARIMFNAKLSLATFAQINSVGGSTLVNARFRFNPREGHDLYLVYDNSHSYDDRDPTLNQQTFLLKYAYTFDLSR